MFIDGNIYGDINLSGNFTIDIFDLLTLTDIIAFNNQGSCGFDIGDITNDGAVNILDVISLSQIILNDRL